MTTSPQTIAVPAETQGDQRVALVPESVKKLIQAGYAVGVEAGAGARAAFADDAYRQAGASVDTDRSALLGRADLVLRVNAPPAGEVDQLRSGAILVGALMPRRHLDVI